MASPEAQFETFLARYTPEVVTVAREVLVDLRRTFAGWPELVYDNYNALAIGWTPTGRTSDVVCSIALYPRWVSLFFLRGAALPDPEHRLAGGGKTVRHVVLAAGARTLAQAPIRALIAQAIAAAPPLTPGLRPGIIIKSISAQQRPRRPAPRLR